MNKVLIFSMSGMILLGLIGGAVYFGITTQSVFGETIYKAQWGHICCEEGAYEDPFKKYADDVSTYECNAYTDECRIKFIYGDLPWTKEDKVCYKINDGSKVCIPWDDSKTIYISYGSKIEFVNAGFYGWQDSRPYYQYEADYRKFYIQGQEEGKVFVHKSCILNSALKERVLAGGLNELSKTGINRCQNYIIGYSKVATKTYSYQGKRVVCQSRNIYEIDTLQMLDGSTNKIQGEWIKIVDCCPHEANCDDDFKFKEVVIKECDYDYQCPNGGEPVALTGTAYVEYNCVDNNCIKSESITVECTNNAICVDKLNKPNAVCKDFKCEIDDDWLGHCGDGKCESVLGETPTSCPDDCKGGELNCEWWETEHPAETKKNIFGTETFKEASCKTSLWIYAVIGAVAFIIIIFILILIMRISRPSIPSY